MHNSQAQLVTIKKALSSANDVVIPFGASNFCLWSPDFTESNWSDLCYGCIHVKQVFLLSGSDWSYNQRRVLFVNSFLTTMSTPDNCRHRRWVFGNLTNFSFVPKASIQPHSSRQQLKLIQGLHSDSCKLSTEDFPFPVLMDAQLVRGWLPIYSSWVLLGRHSNLNSFPPLHWNVLIKGTSDLQISSSTGYLPGCILFGLSATLDKWNMPSWSPAFQGFHNTTHPGFPRPLLFTFFCGHLPYPTSKC